LIRQPNPATKRKKSSTPHRSILNRRARIVQKRYDATAHLYDSLYSEEQTYKVKLIDAFQLRFEGMVLDIGCGTGISMGWKGMERSVGVDISKEMLELASGKGYDAVQADMCHLPFRDRSFRAVTSITSFHHATNRRMALKEAYRVLHTGGYFFLTLLKASDWTKQLRQIRRYRGFRSVGFMDEGKDYLLAMRK